MNQFQDSYAALQGNIRAKHLTELVLCEATECLGRLPNMHSEIAERWKRLAEEPVYPHLRATALNLTKLSIEDRLDAIDWLFRNGDRQRHEGLWITRGAAQQIASFAQEASAIRCHFGWTLHAALQIGVAAKLLGQEPRIVFTDESFETCDIAKLCAAVLEVEIETQWDDAFRRYSDDQFDLEIALPPIGKTYASHALSNKALEWLGSSAAGRLNYEPVTIADILALAPDWPVILGLSASALFRTVGVESIVRDELVASGRLAAVLGVPSGMVYSESGVSTSLLFLNATGNPNSKVRFIDLADETFATKTSRGRYEVKSDVLWRDVISKSTEDTGNGRDVPVQEVRNNSCILTVDRYLSMQTTTKLKEFLDLYDVLSLPEAVELIRPAALPKAAEGEYIVYETSPGDIGTNGLIEAPEKEVRIDRAGLRKARNQQLKPGDVVLSVKGTIGKAGLVSQNAPNREANTFWTVGQSMMILRPRTATIAAEMLYEFFSSDLVREHLQSLAGGAVIQSLNIKDMKALLIPVPELEEQNSIKDAFQRRLTAYQELEQLRQEIETARQKSWPHSQLQLP